MSINKGSHANKLRNVMKISPHFVIIDQSYFPVLKALDVTISPLLDLMDLWQASESYLQC